LSSCVRAPGSSGGGRSTFFLCLRPQTYARRGPDATEPLADLCDFRRENPPILQFGQQAVERDILRECSHALQIGSSLVGPRFAAGTRAQEAVERNWRSVDQGEHDDEEEEEELAVPPYDFWAIMDAFWNQFCATFPEAAEEDDDHIQGRMLVSPYDQIFRTLGLHPLEVYLKFASKLSGVYTTNSTHADLTIPFNSALAECRAAHAEAAHAEASKGDDDAEASEGDDGAAPAEDGAARRMMIILNLGGSWWLCCSGS